MAIERLAVIENGQVVNIVVVTVGGGWVAPNGTISVQSDVAEIGWTYSEGVFTPPIEEQPAFSAERLKEHRDQIIESKIIIFNAKKAICNARSRETLSNTVNYLLFLNDPDATIDWKGPDGWYELTLSDVQGLVMIGGAWVQKAFTAEKTVLENHTLNAYLNIQDALDDFNTEMEE